MSKAYRCDNPMCREFFDPYELQEQYATVEVELHDRENRNNNNYATMIATSTNCCTSANLVTMSKPTYCLCPRCTWTLKELVGIK